MRSGFDIVERIVPPARGPRLPLDGRTCRANGRSATEATSAFDYTGRTACPTRNARRKEPVEINSAFDERAAVHAARIDWVPSPMPGVERRMLDRIGGEVARATSLVRYAAGSRFAPHVHGGGEEFYVLEGVFSDERGDYPAGTYVRNPPSSRHAPSSLEGCVIFVKLWQFEPDDRQEVVVDTRKLVPTEAAGRPGVSVVPLHDCAYEHVRLEHWAPNATIELADHGGFEALVLEGSFRESDEEFAGLSWLRLPPDAALRAASGPRGAKLWVKSGHLSRPQRAPTG